MIFTNTIPSLCLPGARFSASSWIRGKEVPSEILQEGFYPSEDSFKRQIGSLSSSSPSSIVNNSVLQGGAVYPSSMTHRVVGAGSSAVFTPPARFSNTVLPSFANTTVTNVTVIRGKTAYLHCHVLNIGTKTVRRSESLSCCFCLESYVAGLSVNIHALHFRYKATEQGTQEKHTDSKKQNAPSSFDSPY